ncbi:DUF3159 domain-containing protein [Nocardia macrotermitis]|uniref:DUF3159 domain-containing protein n=1 Tax=Nocardia macrotermitis TaxID=2585198 RepID=A0A7K0DEI6_9NOCA|nr:DUF3159 domain-containing protein [Nocardia macrotermitis]MQY23921.1 hypothetical protein [Nocardia macrotermitis]
MNRTDRNNTDDHAPAEPGRAVDLNTALLEGVGGISGMVYTALPVIAFVTANAFCALPIAIGVALGVGLVLTGWRIKRGERLSSAVGGLAGVAVAGGIAAWTGSASDFFVIGIWAALLCGIVTLISLLARRPLTGIAWNAVHGGKHPWRADRPTLLAHDIATLAATFVFAARFAVMQWLYLADATGPLAVAKIAMGTPLTALTVLVIIWAFRRSTRRLITTAPAE